MSLMLVRPLLQARVYGLTLLHCPNVEFLARFVIYGDKRALTCCKRITRDGKYLTDIAGIKRLLSTTVHTVYDVETTPLDNEE